MDTKITIIQTAWNLFRQNGIKATSIERICKTLKISKKTFYKHFQNKESLILESFEINKKRISQLIENSVKENISPFLIFVQILKHFRNIVTAKKVDYTQDVFFPINQTIIEELPSLYPAIWEEIDEYRHQTISTFSQLLEQEKGKYLKEEVNTKVISIMLLSVIDNIIHPNFLKENKIPVDEAVDSVITMLFTGMIKTDKQNEIRKIIYKD